VSRLVAALLALVVATLGFAPPATAQRMKELAGATVAPDPLRGEEGILDYGSEIRILADGTLEITDLIRVRAQGVAIRRGITREFPTRYRDRFGNRVQVGFDLLGVERDGRPEPNFIESHANGVVVNTGNDDYLPVPGEFAYTLRYRTTRQLGFFDGFDELYYNAIPHGSTLPVGHAWVRVHLPADVPRAALRLTAYSGVEGAEGRDWNVVVEDARTVRFEATRPFGPYEGLTVVVGFPKGLVAAPTTEQKVRWFFRDNAGLLIGVLSVLGLLAFYLWRWVAVGRDPHAGPVFPRYEPPADMTPGEVRMLSRMGYDTRTFAADVVAMAVAGALEIDAQFSDWRLLRRPGADLSRLGAAQRALLASVFSGGDRIELENGNASIVGRARSVQQQALERLLVPKYYVTNGRSLMLGIVGSALLGFVAFAVSGGNGIPALVALGVVAVVAHVTFARLLKAPTVEGRRRMDEIEGLRQYLSVAERDEIAGMAVPGAANASGGAPMLDLARYEALLPYAMALDVESKWTDKFTAAVGLEEAARSQPDWYRGQSSLGYTSLGSSLGSALTTQIASAATPPGSSSGGSSGGGGGGSSGGGGGGGGVGGR
jgi:uncharacterized membrane protein YgcG